MIKSVFFNFSGEIFKSSRKFPLKWHRQQINDEKFSYLQNKYYSSIYFSLCDSIIAKATKRERLVEEIDKSTFLQSQSSQLSDESRRCFSFWFPLRVAKAVKSTEHEKLKWMNFYFCSYGEEKSFAFAASRRMFKGDEGRRRDKTKRGWSFNVADEWQGFTGGRKNY